MLFLAAKIKVDTKNYYYYYYYFIIIIIIIIIIIQFFIINVPAQQPQGQLHKQHRKHKKIYIQ
jgi:hypothetical protein